MASNDLTDEQLRALYAWIDAIPLSRPKRNIARDFSDGVLLAEVVAAYFPQLVEIHNYSPASSVQQKIYNFETLNQKVLKRLGYQITRSTIEDVVNCRAGAVEGVLNTLQLKMAKYKEKKSAAEQSPYQGEPEQKVISPARVASQPSSFAQHKEPSSAIKSSRHIQEKPTANSAKSQAMASLDEELLLEKEQQIKELQETVEILELKVTKLEQLVRLKDNKIQKLLQKS